MSLPSAEVAPSGEIAHKATAAKIAIASAGKSVVSALKKRPSRRRSTGTGSKSLWHKLPKNLWKSQSTDPSTTSKGAGQLTEGSRRASNDNLGSDEDSEFSVSGSFSSDASTTASVEDQAESHSSSGSDNAGPSVDSDRDAEDNVKGLPVLEDEDLYQRWELVLKGRHTTDLAPGELRCLAQSGMPLKYRHQLWLYWFSREEIGDVEHLQSSIPEAVAHQIDLDVPRTWPMLLGISDRSSLRRVLRAYAAHNPAVGYCQGMSSMAAVFVVLGFDEAAALRGLCSISESCCPDYFCPSLAGYMRDVAVLGVLIREVLSPATAQRLDDLNIPLNMLVADHFLSLASHTWPLASVVRLWDLYLEEGSSAVFASFLSLLQLYLPETDVGRKQNGSARLEASEQVEAFQKAVLRGVTFDLGTILDMTRELIPSVPKSRIEILRYVFSGHTAAA